MTPRHFTATAFVVCGDSVALHWHQKVKAWLPPGGHILTSGAVRSMA